MNPERTAFSFFIILALTVNFGFFYGPVDEGSYHNVYSLFVALVVNLIAMVLKFGDRTHVGATMLASGIAACIQLAAAAVVWAVAEQVYAAGSSPAVIGTVVSLAGGALLANIVSVVLLIAETISIRR